MLKLFISITNNKGKKKAKKQMMMSEHEDDYNIYGDTRNTRGTKEEGKWTKKSTNMKEQKRIFYIKEKILVRFLIFFFLIF